MRKDISDWLKKDRCSYCNKPCIEERQYKLTKAKGNDVGFWNFCSDVCLYLWLIHYNKLLPLILIKEA